jgi:hypothetical protein
MEPGLFVCPVSALRPAESGKVLARAAPQGRNPEEQFMLSYNAKSFAASPPRTIRGQFLAKNRWSKRARAQLAADILAGRTVITDLTIGQVSLICRVSRPYIAAARKPDRAAARLLRDWEAADCNQRVAFARRAGVEMIFDTLVTASK